MMCERSILSYTNWLMTVDWDILDHHQHLAQISAKHSHNTGMRLVSQQRLELIHRERMKRSLLAEVETHNGDRQ